MAGNTSRRPFPDWFSKRPTSFTSLLLLQFYSVFGNVFSCADSVTPCRALRRDTHVWDLDGRSLRPRPLSFLSSASGQVPSSKNHFFSTFLSRKYPFSSNSIHNTMFTHCLCNRVFNKPNPLIVYYISIPFIIYLLRAISTIIKNKLNNEGSQKSIGTFVRHESDLFPLVIHHSSSDNVCSFSCSLKYSSSSSSFS